VPDEFGLLSEVSRSRVPRVVIAIAAWEDDNANLHGLGRCDGNGLLARGALLFRRGLPVALLQRGENDGEDELLFAVVVKLDADVLIVAGQNGSKTELAMLNLRARRESGFISHVGVLK
jgi:hypothetical protein